MTTHICKGKDCGIEFEQTDRFDNDKFCPLCICEAQMDLIKSHNLERTAISEAMGPDFIKNLLTEIAEGRRPSTVSLNDGTKAVVMDPKLFRLSKGAGNRTERRNWDKKHKKLKKKRK